MEFLGMLGPMLFIGPVIMLIINLIIAGAAKRVAEAKGYEGGADAFALTFFFGIIGYIYAAGLPDLVARGHQQETCYLLRRIASANGINPGAHEKSTDETETEGAPATKGGNGPSVLYNCKSISITSKTGEGRCTMCGQAGTLSYCQITNDIGTKEIPICRDCIDRLRDRSKR